MRVIYKLDNEICLVEAKTIVYNTIFKTLQVFHEKTLYFEMDENTANCLIYATMESGFLDLSSYLPQSALYTEEEKAIIDGIELALDNGFDVSNEDILKYELLVKRRIS